MKNWGLRLFRKTSVSITRLSEWLAPLIRQEDVLSVLNRVEEKTAVAACAKILGNNRGVGKTALEVCVEILSHRSVFIEDAATKRRLVERVERYLSKLEESSSVVVFVRRPPLVWRAKGKPTPLNQRQYCIVPESIARNIQEMIRARNARKKAA